MTRALSWTTRILTKDCIVRELAASFIIIVVLLLTYLFTSPAYWSIRLSTSEFWR